MIEITGEVGPGHQRCPQQQRFQWVQPAVVDQFLPPAGEGVFLNEVPILGHHPVPVFAHDFDPVGIAHAQPHLVGDADEGNRERVEALHLGGHGVNRHLVGGGQDDVLLVAAHGAGAGAIAGEGAVHHGEQPRVDILLNHQQVHQRFVNDGVRPVPFPTQQPTEGVLHCASDGGENVRLDCRQLDNVAPDEKLGDIYSLRVDLVQYQERLFRLVAHPVVLWLEEVDIAQAVFFDDVLVLVVPLAHVGVHDDGVVVAGDQVLVASGLQRPDHSFQLPGGGRAGRVPGLPGDVDLEDGLSVLGQGLPQARQFHQAGVVL